MLNEVVEYLKKKGLTQAVIEITQTGVQVALGPGALVATKPTADEALLAIEQARIDNAEAKKAELEAQLSQVNAIIATKPKPADNG